jgi:hypothetical protein
MVTMPWANEAAPLKGSADRFAPTTKFNDGFFLLLMLANLIGVAVIAATDLPGLKAGIQKRDDDVVPASSIAVGVVIVLVPSLITGAACISLFFYLVQRNAELMLKVTLGLSLGMLVVLIGLLFGTGSLSGIACGILLIFGLLICGYLYWSSRQFIKFTGACFEVTLSFLRRHPSTLVLGPVSLVPAVCWAVLVSLCLYANQQRAAEIDDADEARMVQVKMLFLVLSLYWVWQYVASTVHVTVAGAFASWYFFGSRATSVVLSSLRRGFWSAGSVCLGSLIVAILQFIRNLVSRNGDGENFLAQMVLSCIESLVRFYNKYAFCYVAIYGQSFSEAGRSVFSLFERHGIATLLNDSTTDLILTMAVFIGGAFGMLATGVIGIAVYGTSSGALFFVMAGGAFVSGGLVYFVMQTVDSCVATLFVCFVEDPAALSVTAPEAYTILSTAWAQRYPEFSLARAHGAF